MALGMTLNGAAGTTYDAMQSTLGWQNLSEEEINNSYRNIINLLIALDPKIVFEIANSIWYDQNRMIPEQIFLDLNKKYFLADVLDIDFSQAGAVDIINNWISDKTHGKIEKMLDQIPGNAVLYLINALYFYGQWLYTFDKEDTEPWS